MGHQNREAMAQGGVRVEPTVRLGRVGTVLEFLDGAWLERNFCWRFRWKPLDVVHNAELPFILSGDGVQLQ